MRTFKNIHFLNFFYIVIHKYIQTIRANVYTRAYCTVHVKPRSNDVVSISDLRENRK